MDASYRRDWINGSKAADLIGVWSSNFHAYYKRWGITSQRMEGRQMYYLPDCERVRDHLLKVRAEREAKRQREAA